jgi:hypothetical protein
MGSTIRRGVVITRSHPGIDKAILTTLFRFQSGLGPLGDAMDGAFVDFFPRDLGPGPSSRNLKLGPCMERDVQGCG